MKYRTSLLAGVALAVFSLSTSAFAAAQITDTTKNFKLHAGDTVALENLAGRVSVTHGDGDTQITAHIVSGGRDNAAALELNKKASVQMDATSGGVRVRALFPVDDIRDYAYDPHPGHGNYNSTVHYQGERVRVSSDHDGADLHVDFEIQVPDGVNVTLDNKVGDINATGLRSDLHAKSGNGAVETADTHGLLDLDTGSGGVHVTDHEGDVNVDTGSGAALIERVKGGKRIAADTGSGEVTMRNVSADLLYIDTGSGAVQLDGAQGSLTVDTGSGSVSGDDVVSGSDVKIDTGSGSVRLSGDFSAVRKLLIDTGSGSATLRTRGKLNLHLKASAGSGGVHVDVPDMRNVRRDHDEFTADLGNGEGTAFIDTGSGSVRIESD